MSFDSILTFSDKPTSSKKSAKNVVNIDPTFLADYFSKKTKLKKDDYIVFTNTSSILGTQIQSNDTVLEVILINSSDIMSSKFISVTIRYVIKRELKKTAAKYISIDNSRRIPLLVERKYIEDDKYYEHHLRINEQFL